MILAFHGKLGSGKDTAGERMAAMLDMPTNRISFAAPLKQSAAALLDIEVADWEAYKNDPDVKILLQVGWVDCDVVFDYDDDGNPLVGDGESPYIVREFTAREFLQRYGTESHRDVFGGDFWVEQAVETYRLNPHEFTYVTDCRFVNEAVAIRGLGGYIVRVVGEDEATGEHASETLLPDEYISFYIDNTVRGDDFVSLDAQLADLAGVLGLPLQQEVTA